MIKLTEYDAFSGSKNVNNLSVITEASQKADIAMLQPRDHIEAFEGKKSGVCEIGGGFVAITVKGRDKRW